MANDKKYPPMIQQFIDIQKEHPSAIVCTEVGKFYEIWGIDELGIDNASRAAQILDLALTKRNKKAEDSPTMCGFPSHVAMDKFKTLVDNGETVVVVSQSLRGKKKDQNKKVDREISAILSPGTIVSNIEKDKKNYFASIFVKGESAGVTLVDISTGEVFISEILVKDLDDFLYKYKPREILCSEEIKLKTDTKLIHVSKKPVKKISEVGNILSMIYDIENPTSNSSEVLNFLNLEFWSLGSLSLGNLLNFLVDYNKHLVKKLEKPKAESPKDFLNISPQSFLSLELLETQDGKDNKQSTLFGVLDKCKTSMGKRLLRDWILNPLKDEESIQNRLDKVAYFLKKEDYLLELSKVYDLPRFSRRMILKSVIPYEMINFIQSLSICKDVLDKDDQNELSETISNILFYINENINTDSLVNKSKSFFIGDYAEKIDKYLQRWIIAESNILNYKKEIENQITNKQKLRIEENKDSFSLIGPKGLKNDLDNLKIKHKIMASQLKITSKEWDELSLECIDSKTIFSFHLKKAWDDFQENLIDLYGEHILKISHKISELDVLSNFARISKERNYSRAKIINNERSVIQLYKMRHPVVEESKNLSEGFIPNDFLLGGEKNILTLYGPNSAGKSTLLKSVALNVIMNQIGCFIPSKEGSALSIFENIHTRMTTFDSLSEGISTFTREMVELQKALTFYKEKSLFLFDEIGRGTSVEDGASIAYATISYLNKEENNSLTLFATHYHDIADDLAELNNVDIKHLHCELDGDSIIFNRQLTNGPGDGSYGLIVAKSCNIPDELLRIAKRFNKKYSKNKISRYNSSIHGNLCPICEEEEAKETHHLIEQLQGKIEEVEINGQKVSINNKNNLVMLCPNCHDKITRKEIFVEGKLHSSKGFVLKIKKPNK